MTKPVAAPNLPHHRVVKFINFTDQDFTCSWNGHPKLFKAHDFQFMQYGLAEHFAKHLTNRELLKRGRENDTSPKRPNENPYFMEFFRRAIEEVGSNTPNDPDLIAQEAIDREMKSKLAGGATAPEGPKVEGTPETTKKEGEFEDIPVDDEDDDAPPAEPSNMAAKGAKKSKK